MLKLDPDDARPPYRQLADRVRAQVTAGTYIPGERLPSYGSLAEEFGVSLGVVKRAMAELRDERVIVIRHGQGSYVRMNSEGVDEVEGLTLADMRAALDEVRERVEVIERRLDER